MIPKNEDGLVVEAKISGVPVTFTRLQLRELFAEYAPHMAAQSGEAADLLIEMMAAQSLGEGGEFKLTKVFGNLLIERFGSWPSEHLN